MKRLFLSIAFIYSITILNGCASTTQTAAAKSFKPVLDRIIARSELVVGTAASMPPFNMTTRSGEVIGLDVDLAEKISNALGVKLRLAAMPFAELLPALEAGRVDMVLSSMTITPERNMKAAFAGPYYISGKAFLTKLDAIAASKNTEGVNNPQTRLAVLKGSTSQAFLEKAMPLAKVVATKDYDEAISLVIQGKVDALVADYPVCVISVLRHPDKGLLSLNTPLTYDRSGSPCRPMILCFSNGWKTF
jgi:polar amino acid transport system substrate-binding protein